jgi:uncharacterized protein YigE (DUF2233 family)
MNQKSYIFCGLFLALAAGLLGFGRTRSQKTIDETMLSCVVNPKTEDIRLYWKNDTGEIYKSIRNLKAALEQQGRVLTFATNGGMFKKDFVPQGLFIQDSKLLNRLDTTSGIGNFFLKPNGVFYITESNTCGVTTTEAYPTNEKVKYATQSGPMLVIDGQLHPAFVRGSKNLNIRNGVGILPDNTLLFAISKKEINFYDFALFFQNLGCKNALYLDGFVSRAYYPKENWLQIDGNFGVMIGVSEKK